MKATVEQLFDSFSSCGISYFSGVPDSTFKEWMSFLADNEDKLINRIAANEGAAVAHATGYYLASQKVGVVYLQNSGLGNAVNPLTSLVDPLVYGVPLILMMGWRGMPGIKDEPQHARMGQSTLSILDAISIPYKIIEPENYHQVIKEVHSLAIERKGPVAIIVKPGFLAPYSQQKNISYNEGFSREEFIEKLVKKLSPKDVLFSTTGKISRELYEVSERLERSHSANFYNIGSMGHLSAIALEFSLQKKTRKTIVLDGDGSVIMHLGNLATNGFYAPSNFIHIVLDNGAHESTGGQPTISPEIDWSKVFEGCGYKKTIILESFEDLVEVLKDEIHAPISVVVKIKQGSRADLGRPKLTPEQIKDKFIDGVRHVDN